MMAKKWLVLAVLTGLAVSVGPLAAEAKRPLSLPEQAAEVAPNVFDLGAVIDPLTKKEVQGYAFIHRREPAARGGNSNNAKPGKSACYGFLAEGAKWKGLESWVVNADNGSGLGADFILDTLAAGIAKWEDAADGKLLTGPGRDILGAGSLTVDSLAADLTSPDGLNEVYFNPLADAGTIGVTVVWGYFSGPVMSRELLEWDMVFNSDYPWSAVGEESKMDFDNIATHELGHAVGLGDLYNANCGEETMYGYAAYGETKKRTLEAGDIAGIARLYK